MTTPLTPEEEAELRERVFIRGQHIDNLAVARLLATLDAERARPVPVDGLDVEAAINTLRRGGLGERQARNLAIVALAAALTGERHDLDDEHLTPKQRGLLVDLDTHAALPPDVVPHG